MIGIRVAKRTLARSRRVSGMGFSCRSARRTGTAGARGGRIWGEGARTRAGRARCQLGLRIVPDSIEVDKDNHGTPGSGRSRRSRFVRTGVRSARCPSREMGDHRCSVPLALGGATAPRHCQAPLSMTNCMSDLAEKSCRAFRAVSSPRRVAEARSRSAEDRGPVTSPFSLPRRARGWGSAWSPLSVCQSLP